MSSDLIIKILQVILFAMPLVISPGPNNLLAASHCARFGFRRTLPCLAGISLGVFIIFMAVAQGLGGIFDRYPLLHTVLKLAGAVYILYLAYQLCFAHITRDDDDSNIRPVTVIKAALLQILNPKIWLLAATATSTFLPLTKMMYIDALLLSSTLGMIFFPCNALWAFGGFVIQQRINTTVFFRVMGGLTALSVVLLFV